MGYLDDNGLERLWGKIKSYVSSLAAFSGNYNDLSNKPTYLYGYCSTAGSTAAKTCSITGFSLVTGVHIVVYFVNAVTVANATLNVSGTGAKPIYYKNARLPANYIAPCTPVELVYYGSYWRIVGDLNAPVQADIDDVSERLAQSTDGKFVLGNGLKIFWGTVTGLSCTATASTTVTLKFPENFKGTGYTVMLTPVSAKAGIRLYDTKTTSQVTAGLYSLSGAALSDVSVGWLAVGY